MNNTALPPAARVTFSCIITLDRSSKKQNPLALNAEVNAIISENSSETDVVIFTDGSVIRHQRSAWAFRAWSSGRVIHKASCAFGITTSSMTMEIMAVTEALAWLESQEFQNVCILSDSMSMIRKFEAGSVCRQWVESIQRSVICRVTFIFVAGHAGVEGNEKADRLATSSTIAEGQPVDQADVVNVLKERGRAEDFEGNESSTLHRLREMGIRVGTARKETLTGWMKRLVNHHRMGTIGRGTLIDLLKGASAHLWTCPECSEDDPP